MMGPKSVTALELVLVGAMGQVSGEATGQTKDSTWEEPKELMSERGLGCQWVTASGSMWALAWAQAWVLEWVGASGWKLAAAWAQGSEVTLEGVMGLASELPTATATEPA